MSTGVTRLGAADGAGKQLTKNNIEIWTWPGHELSGNQQIKAHTAD